MMDPLVRATAEGRPMLPDEVPVIPYYHCPPPGRKPLREAAALFEDLSEAPAVTLAPRRVDRWQIGGSALEVRVACPVGAEWGESGALIAEWFRTGEEDCPLVEDAEVPTPSWFAALGQRLKRFWTSTEEETAGALSAAPELT